MKFFPPGIYTAIAVCLATGISCLASLPAFANGAFNKPVYNPDTKSYFELYSPDASDPKINTVRNAGHINYAEALHIAAKRSFKGVHGRLAIIKSKETHEFLAKQLHPSVSAWIGLRYYCRFKKLMWGNGTILKSGRDFAIWGPNTWNINGPSPRTSKQSECWRSTRDFYLPVHYWPVEDGFKWNANDYAKEFNAVIIEYRTGKP